jgi:hypothetical protein
MVFNTRLRFVASLSPERLAAFFNQLPFKVEIKSVVPQGKRWYCWFVLPDNIESQELSKNNTKGLVDIPSIELED